MYNQCCHLSGISTKTGGFDPRFRGQILLLVGLVALSHGFGFGEFLSKLVDQMRQNSLDEIKWVQKYCIGQGESRFEELMT